MKIERLLAMIIILLQNKKVTASYLAERFQVSKRTIYRDVTDLTLAGIPIITNTGSDGGIMINEDYKIDKTLFTQKELEAICSGLLCLDSISTDNRYQNVISKFASTTENMYIANHIMIDLSSHYKDKLSISIKKLHQAIEDSNVISFQYHNANGESLRYVEPYIIVFQWSSWYVLGFESCKDTCKLFKLSRMTNLSITSQFFSLREIPSESLDFHHYFTDEIHAEVLFDASVRYRLIDEYGINSFQELNNGSLLFTFPFTNEEYLLEWILSFADKAELIQPVDLRKVIKERAHKLLLKYEEH